MSRQRGVVARLFYNKGFGFIRDEEGYLRFFHAQWTVGNTMFDFLREGQAVTFTPVKVESDLHNGLQAREVKADD
jgi:cold shock CspA family protein